MDIKTIIEQDNNSDFKTKLRPEDAKRLRTTVLDKNIIDSRLKKRKAKRSRFLFRLTFNELMEELEDQNISEWRRKRIIKYAEKRIKKLKKICDKKASELSGESAILMRQATEEKIDQMKKTLERMKNMDEIEPIKEEVIPPVVNDEEQKIQPQTIEEEKNQSLNVFEIAEEIQRLNLDVDVRVKIENGEPILYFDKPMEGIILPDGFEYNEKDGITNKHTTSDAYISINVRAAEKENPKIVTAKAVETQIDENIETKRKEEDSKLEESSSEEEISKLEEPSSEEEIKKDINDLTTFTSYDDYIISYRNQNITSEEYDKFLLDMIHGIIPTNMLSEEEFTDQRRKQLEEIKHRELEEKAHEIEKQLIEINNTYEAAKEYVEQLEKKVIEQKQRLELIRNENTELEQKVSDEKTKNQSLSEDNEKLNDTIKERDGSIKSQQKEIFRLEKKSDKLESDLKKKETIIEKQKKKLEDYDNKINSLKKENRDLKLQVTKLEANVRAELDKLTSSKEELKIIKNTDSSTIDKDLKAAEEKYRKQAQNKQKEDGPKHMREKPAPKNMKEPAPQPQSSEVAKQIAQLNDKKELLKKLIEAEKIENSQISKTK